MSEGATWKAHRTKKEQAMTTLDREMSALESYQYKARFGAEDDATDAERAAYAAALTEQQAAWDANPGQFRTCVVCEQRHTGQVTCDEVGELMWADRQIG